MFVHYHLNIGIYHLILFFDNPDDPAIGHLTNYPQVTCIKCDEEHWSKTESGPESWLPIKQRANANIALSMSRERAYEWVIHVDGDELIHSRESILAALDSIRHDVVRFEINEAVPEKAYYDNAFSEISLFKKWPSRPRRIIARVPCRRAFFKKEYFRGHSESKTAVRVKSNIMRMGVHRPEDKNVYMERSERIRLLHFESRGFDMWKSKWTNILDHYRKFGQGQFEFRKNRLLQLKAFAKAYNKGDKELLRLYRRLNYIPKHEEYILNLLNMLMRTELEKSLFRMPETSVRNKERRGFQSTF
jgi:hypothetical protein